MGYIKRIRIKIIFDTERPQLDAWFWVDFPCKTGWRWIRIVLLIYVACLTENHHLI